jgi:hypothetical protein
MRVKIKIKNRENAEKPIHKTKSESGKDEGERRTLEKEIHPKLKQRRKKKNPNRDHKEQIQPTKLPNKKQKKKLKLITPTNLLTT